MAHSPWHDLILTAAAGVLVGGGVLFMALSLLARRAPAGERSRPGPAGAGGVDAVPLALAVALALGGAVIHLAAAPSHIDELGAVGWGFVAAAIFQAAWALAWAIAQTPGVALLGAAGSLGIAVVWVWSRTVGLPVGPVTGIPEPVGVPDAVATVFEVALAVLLVGRLGGTGARLPQALRRAPPLGVVAAVPVIGMVLVTTTMAVTLALWHDHAAGSEHDADAPAAGEVDTGH